MSVAWGRLKKMLPITPEILKPLASGILFAVVWGFVALNFQDNSWKIIREPEVGFDPGKIVGLVAHVAAYGVVICFVVLGTTHSVAKFKYDRFVQAEQNKPLIEKRSEELSKHEGFTPMPAVTIGVRKIWPHFKRIHDDANIVQDEVRYLEDLGDGKIGDSKFIYSILFDEFSWNFGSWEKVQGAGTDRMRIEKAVQDAYIKSSVKDARAVICFGLASSEETPEFKAEYNERLSDARAINLCRALIKAELVAPDHQTLRGLGGGYSTQAPSSVADPGRLRAAIIIAVEHTHRDLSPGEFAAIIAERVSKSVKGVDLGKYSRKPENFRASVRVYGGNYLKPADVNYKSPKDAIFLPMIPKVTSSEIPEKG